MTLAREGRTVENKARRLKLFRGWISAPALTKPRLDTAPTFEGRDEYVRVASTPRFAAADTRRQPCLRARVPLRPDA
jgi:hypothetical protein